MAEESKGFRQAGFCFSKAQAGGVCGWVFLARVSAAWNKAEAECVVLGQEARGEQGAGSVGDAAAAGGGLAGGAGVGARVARGGEGGGQSPGGGGADFVGHDVETSVFFPNIRVPGVLRGWFSSCLRGVAAGSILRAAGCASS